MSMKNSFGERLAQVSVQLQYANTRAGFEFNPNEDSWLIVDSLTKNYFNFDIGHKYSDDFKNGWKMVSVWYLSKYSVRHAINMHTTIKSFLRFLAVSHGWTGEEVNWTHLSSYHSLNEVREKGYLSAIAGQIRKWRLLGYYGVQGDAVEFLNSLRLKGNKKGEAVLTMDPHKGPLTSVELEGLMAALCKAYGEKTVSTREYILFWLFAALGMRPIQYAALKVKDFKKIKCKEGFGYLLGIPRAKQQNTLNARTLMKDRALVEEVGGLLEIYISDLKKEFLELGEKIGELPLFPSKKKGKEIKLQEFRFHSTSAEISEELREIGSRLDTYSERTGKPLEIGAQRLRRTVGTRAAEEGFGVMVIAELLDHSDTQNAGIYVESTPAIAQRIDRAVAMHLAPLAHAFSGKIINDESQATRGSDKSSRIVDLRIDQSGSAMGSCGQHSFCGFSAPIACYTCSCFEPWLDGPHEAVLHHLIEKRERLLETTDERIASINDRTILAVAEVVQLCAQMKTKKLGA